MKSFRPIAFLGAFALVLVTTMANEHMKSTSGLSEKNHIMILDRSFLGSNAEEHQSAMDQLTQHLGLSQKDQDKHLTLLPHTGVVLTRDLPQGAYDKLNQMEPLLSGEELRFKQSRSFLKNTMSTEMEALSKALSAVVRDKKHHVHMETDTEEAHKTKHRLVGPPDDDHWDKRAVLYRTALDQHRAEDNGDPLPDGLKEGGLLDVHVFVIDCGIYPNSRASITDALLRGNLNYNALEAVEQGHLPNDLVNLHGNTDPGMAVGNPCMHGTQVAEKVVDDVYGFGAQVKLHDVQVIHYNNDLQFNNAGVASREGAFDDQTGTDETTAGWTSSYIQGVEWTVAKVLANALLNPPEPSVIQMSTYDKVDGRIRQAAFAALAGTEAVVTVSSGNRSSHTDDFAPRLHAVANAITIGNAKLIEGRSVRNDPHAWVRAFSSNWGVVDMLAPGTEVLGCTNPACGATRLISGTSFSTPFVAGLVATIVATNPNLQFDAAYTKAVVLALTTQGEIGEIYNHVDATLANNRMMWHGLTVAEKQDFQDCITDVANNAGNIAVCFRAQGIIP